MSQLTDEQELTRTLVRKFAEAEIKPIAAEIDRDHRFPRESLPKLAEHGLMGMPFPERWGGAGTDHVSYAIAIEELARVCATTAVIVESHVSLATWPIFHFGTEAQRERYLPGLTSGRTLGAFALTEPGAGTDAGSVQTTAFKDGDGYSLNGSKVFITGGGYADVFVVFARTPPTGVSAFVVERATEGFTVGEGEDKLGIRGSSTPPLFFNDLWVPQDALLGQVGDGLRIALATLDGGRVGIAAQAVGIAQGALEASVEYAKERRQFGKPISAFQAIQWMVADMATDVEAARQLTYRAAGLQDAGEPFGVAAAQAKLFAAQAATRVASQAIQIHGGNGYTVAYPVERAYRDARITEIYEGTNEVQRMVIAKSLLR
ncbi:MAG: acyl-CoA dehydrogenase family protein [Bifidobacteriaceae bacterium]|nr:acyl-CoA dehydrogenase family protein [Bifidobacteriaceae bacterium]